MRRPIFHMPHDAAMAFLRAAPVVRVATTDEAGRPILRTVHGVVVGDAVAFHGSPVGEKQAGIGRPAVIGADEVVAAIPSYFVDPERACPATTYYRSVQVHGVLEEVVDPDAKAAMLQALMAKMQPEGGHVPIRADHPLYAKAVAGIQVLQVTIGDLDGKAKLGQNLRPEQVGRMVEHLWRRGAATDPRAIDLIQEANPALVVPAFLQAPAGRALRCQVSEAEVRTFAAGPALDAGGRDAVMRALALPTAAWVGAVDHHGRLVAVGAGAGERPLVLVAAGTDEAGLLPRLAALLREHPALRTTAVVAAP